MKLSFRSLFALMALATAMGTMSIGCSKSDDATKAAPSTGNSAVKPDGSGAAAPPKTHD